MPRKSHSLPNEKRNKQAEIQESLSNSQNNDSAQRKRESLPFHPYSNVLCSCKKASYWMKSLVPKTLLVFLF